MMHRAASVVLGGSPALLALGLAALPAAATPVASAERLRLARQYLYGGLFWSTLAELTLLALVGLLVFSGASARLRAALQRRLERFFPALARRRWPLVLLYGTLLVVLIELASLPFNLYLGYVREHAYGFSHLSAAGWWADWSKTLAVSVVLTVPAILVAYQLLHRWRRRWWLGLWLLSLLLAVLSVAIQPVFIAPLFNRFTPLPEGALRTRILAMAREAGIPASQVYVVNRSRQSGHTNAYVVGVLGSERIVLYDTLLRAQTPAEIEFVMGHEMGHYVLHHLWKGLGFTALLLLAVFWLTSRGFAWAVVRCPRMGFRQIDDVAGLPLLLLLLGGLLFLASPASNGFSRWEEHQADAYGLRICQCPAAAVSGFEREISTDLIDPNPPRWIQWWYFTHPSQQERIEFARGWGKRAGGSHNRNVTGR